MMPWRHIFAATNLAVEEWKHCVESDNWRKLLQCCIADYNIEKEWLCLSLATLYWDERFLFVKISSKKLCSQNTIMAYILFGSIKYWQIWITEHEYQETLIKNRNVCVLISVAEHIYTIELHNLVGKCLWTWLFLKRSLSMFEWGLICSWRLSTTVC